MFVISHGGGLRLTASTLGKVFSLVIRNDHPWSRHLLDARSPPAPRRVGDEFSQQRARRELGSHASQVAPGAGFAGSQHRWRGGQHGLGSDGVGIRAGVIIGVGGATNRRAAGRPRSTWAAGLRRSGWFAQWRSYRVVSNPTPTTGSASCSPTPARTVFMLVGAPASRLSVAAGSLGVSLVGIPISAVPPWLLTPGRREGLRRPVVAGLVILVSQNHAATQGASAGCLELRPPSSWPCLPFIRWESRRSSSAPSSSPRCPSPFPCAPR